MADLKISAAPAVVTPAAADEFATNQAGVSKKTTRAQFHALVATEHFTVPAANEPLTPTIGFGDGDSGFYESVDDTLKVSVGGVAMAIFDVLGIQSEHGSGPLIKNLPSSATVPNIVPNKTDDNTGIGRSGADTGVLIAGGFTVASFTETSALVQLIMPLQNNAASPSLAFGDGDTGFFEQSDGQLSVSIEGTRRAFWNLSGMQGNASASWALNDETATLTNPTISPSRSDLDTGIGAGAVDTLSLVAGGLDCINIAEVAAARQIGFYVTAPIALQTGVAVTAAGVHAALVALGLITA